MNAKVTPIRTALKDAETASQHHVEERCAILDKMDTAEDLLGGALLEGLRMTVRYGETSPDEVRQNYTRCGSPKVYASWFNRGFKAQQIVGEKLALDAIDRAAKVEGGSAFKRACDVLKALCDTAKSSGVKELNQKDSREAIKSAVESLNTPRAQKLRGPKSRHDTTMAQAALQSRGSIKAMAAFVKLAAQNAHHLAAPEGRETAFRDAVSLLEEAAEAWAIFK